ncbi:MAG TPA: hypothetical protein VFI08_04805 [Spirochaetia bacterium]|nr:hypothetical protein [Spirochaetia bacterium]
MEELIRTCADKIVELLRRSGEVNVMNLCESLSERSVVGYQALGWLAHDGRVAYRRQGSQVYVSLAPPSDASDAGNAASASERSR